MEYENERIENVKKFDEFISGKRKSLEVIMSREDKKKGKYSLCHFIDKNTGLELFQKWLDLKALFGRVKEKESENIGGKKPYEMIYSHEIKKIYCGDEYVGNRASQLSALVLLSDCIQMNTGKLIKKRSKKAMTQQDIADELGLSLRRTASILQDLKTNGVIERKNGAYYVNRKFWAKGQASK